ncbi:hypothetical protein, partial [Xanthovirga aplysinae]|uniref:hypothetical protein n=1 Tax=Xanthovirga aplysinae TaxID=2529853 RepID=UPI001CA4396A
VADGVIALGKDASSALLSGGKAIINSVKGAVSSEASSVGDSLTSVSEDIGEIINVSVDTDIDSEVDTEVDTAITIDIDIDIDIDFLVVIDIDIDTNIDIDVVIDVVIDVNVDITTEIDLGSPALNKLVTNIGKAFWENKGTIMKGVLKNAAIMGGMEGAQKLLDSWYEQAEVNIAERQPSEVAPLGLFMDYMMNPANSIEDRWNTFAD